MLLFLFGFCGVCNATTFVVYASIYHYDNGKMTGAINIYYIVDGENFHFIDLVQSREAYEGHDNHTVITVKNHGSNCKTTKFETTQINEKVYAYPVPIEERYYEACAQMSADSALRHNFKITRTETFRNVSRGSYVDGKYSPAGTVLSHDEQKYSIDATISLSGDDCTIKIYDVHHQQTEYLPAEWSDVTDTGCFIRRNK
jgi:hypothetical protein